MLTWQNIENQAADGIDIRGFLKFCLEPAHPVEIAGNHGYSDLEKNRIAFIFIRISPMRLVVIFGLVLPGFVGLGFVGCGIKEQTDGLKETSKTVKQNLQDLQNRNAIDFETQDMLNTVYQAYLAFSEKNGAPPGSWSDLAGAPDLSATQRVQIRTASRQVKDIVWGAELKNMDEESGKAKLASIENSLLGNVVVLQANGKFNMVSRNELNLIPLAE